MSDKFSVTFKKHPQETGLAGIGHPNPLVDIKINKKVVGLIVGPSWKTPDNLWRVRFTVKKDHPDENPNCDWKWMQLKIKFETEADARTWAKENFKGISEKYTLHYLED